MATAEHIVSRALTRLSILRMGKSPSAEQLAAGLDSLNEMIAGWSADGVYLDPLIPIPDKYTTGIIAMMAMRLASDYGAAAVVPAGLAQEAQDGWRGLLAGYVFAPDATVDKTILNMPSQRLIGWRGNAFTTESTNSVSGFCTLTAGVTTTTVQTTASFGSSATITLTPYTASAQDEWHAQQPTAAPGTVAGQFIITHLNNAVLDRVFEYLAQF